MISAVQNTQETSPLLSTTAGEVTKSNAAVCMGKKALVLVGLALFVVMAIVFYSASGSVAGTKGHVNDAAGFRYFEADTTATSTSDTFRGAVLEYQCLYHESYQWAEPSANGNRQYLGYTPVTTVEEAKYYQNLNLERITPFVESAAESGVDILVLGEFALNGLVFDRDEMFLYLEEVPDVSTCASPADCTPCNNEQFSSRPTLQQLSCLAQSNRLNLVVNYGDVVYCDSAVDEQCPSDGHYQYNTQIVFDFDGAVIAKYWKIHTYNEKEYNVPAVENYVSFTVTSPNDASKTADFGIIICYDSMYETPLAPLIDAGITNVVMSHWWVNTPPTMDISTWTQAVSQTYGINLLVAASVWFNIDGGYDIGPSASSGSAILSQGTVVADWYNTQNDDIIGKLLIGDVPINIENNAQELGLDFGGYVPTDIAPGSLALCEDSMILNNKKPLRRKDHGSTFTQTLSCGGFTCTASVTVESTMFRHGEYAQLDQKERNYLFMYIMSGYYGTPDGGNVSYYEHFCSISVCDESCYAALPGFTTHTMFSDISISGNFGEDSTLFKLVGDYSGKSADDVAEGLAVTRSGDDVVVSGEDVNEVLLGLSVIGRVFDKDAVSV